MNPTFVWWKGKVEDRKDPLKLGRCKVRILGYHTDDKSEIPTEDLPFAYPAMPINTRPSDSPIGPVEGTWVMGFFADGENAQQPIMTHVIDAGYKTADDPTITPEPNWGKSKIPAGEVNVNRLARGDKTDTYVDNYESMGKIAVAGALNESWELKDLEYGAEYPYNRVEESQSGHVHEIDDTAGNERIAVAHKSGTVDVMGSTGDRVAKVMGDNYSIVVKNNNIYTKGSVNITADSDVNIKGRIVRLEGQQVRIKGDLGVLIESPVGAFVSAPFLSTDPKLGGAIMHGATGSPFVAPAGIPPDALMVDVPSSKSDSVVVRESPPVNPLALLRATILGGFNAKTTMFLGPAECGTDMLDGLKANFNALDMLKLLTKIFNLVGKNTSQTTSEDSTKGKKYVKMENAIEDAMKKEEGVVDAELKTQLESEGGSLKVVDDDGVIHTVTSLDDAISLVESGKVLSYFKDDEPEPEPVDNVIPVSTETPKMTNCCETCGEVTCVCTS